MIRLFQTFCFYSFLQIPLLASYPLGFDSFFATFPMFPGWCEHCLKLCWSLRRERKYFGDLFWSGSLLFLFGSELLPLWAPASPLWLIRFFPELFPWIKNDWLFCVLYHLFWGLVSPQICFFALSSSCSQASLGGFFTTFIQCCLILCSLYFFFLLYLSFSLKFLLTICSSVLYYLTQSGFISLHHVSPHIFLGTYKYR